jgi:hypothetical protein
MAESKTSQFALFINAGSEKTGIFGALRINSLARPSERFGVARWRVAKFRLAGKSTDYA